MTAAPNPRLLVVDDEPDLRTLYVTTASDKRPADELAVQPLAGRVLYTRVDVPGLPVNFARA